MKILFRYLLILSTVLFILISLALCITPCFFKTDAVRDHLEHFLSEQLQRDIHIQDISFSFFPDINIHISDITLGNAVGFEQIPQATVQSIELYLDIWPLFEKKLMFKKILFQDVLVNFHRKADGHNNWNDLLSVLSNSKEISQKNHTSFTTENSFSLLTLGSISVNNAEIQLNDELNHHQIVVSQLKYQCTGFIRQIIDLEFNISGIMNYPAKGICHIDSNVNLDGRASFHFKQKRFSIDDANLIIDSSILLPDDQFVESHLDAKLAFSADHGALELSNMTFYLNDNQVNGDLYARNIFDIPSVSGHLVFSSENLMDTLSFFFQPIGFDGSIRNEITFQTRGKTIDSIFHHLDINMKITMGSGQLVWPEAFAEKYASYIQSIGTAEINIHPKEIRRSDKNNEKKYHLMTDVMGRINKINNELDLEFDLRELMLTGSSLRDITIETPKFEIQSLWDKLSGHYAIHGNANVDGEKQKAILKDIIISGPDINAKLNVDMEFQKKQFMMDSQVDININHFRKILSIFPFKMPEFTNDSVYDQIHFKSNIFVNNKDVQLKEMSCNIDKKASVKGNIRYQFDPNQLDLDLKVDHLNVDRYWIKYKANQQDYSQKKLTVTSPKTKASFYQTGTIVAKVICNHLTYYNLLFDHARFNLNGKNGLFRLTPIVAELYDGDFTGHWTFDYRHKRPKTSVMLQCNNIQVDKFLTDYVHFDKIIGKLNMKASLSSDIKNRRLIYSTINGNAKLELTNGVINGIQIVPTEVQKQILNMHKKKHSSLGIPKQQFVDKMTGQVRFRNGMLINTDMKATSERLKVKGKGTLDLVSKKVDYTFHVRISPYPMIPYKVKGPVGSPQTSLDTSEILSSFSKFFNQAGNFGPDAIKDTLDLGTKALDVNIDPLQKTVEKGSEAIKSTIDKSSGTIKETLGVGTDALEASKEAIQSIGSRLKGLFQKDKDEKE